MPPRLRTEPSTSQAPATQAGPTNAPPSPQAPPVTTRAGTQWPDYTYGGPNDLCRAATFPESELIKVGSGYRTATHSAEAALVALGYDGVVVDGYLDASSAAALTRFQNNHGLVADGTLGQQSWTALRERLLHYQKC